MGDILCTSFHYQIPQLGIFFGRAIHRFAGLAVLLNAFTFAQSTHAPLTPLSHCPADEEEEDGVADDENDEGDV